MRKYITKVYEIHNERYLQVQIAAEEEGEIKGKGKEDVESGPEEEEVPTRGFLKRQANMIVDAKSRSKRGNRKR